MGREIRRVPADWDHPRQPCPHSSWRGGCAEARAHKGHCFLPLFDCSYRDAATRWKTRLLAWEHGTDPDKVTHPDLEFWEWAEGPPDRVFYRPDWAPETRTHYQVYETVSEGTPVTPHFETKTELIEYLVQHGDMWDQYEGRGGWSRDAATKFVDDAWAPTAFLRDDQIFFPRDGWT
jgi:hypothetical protein